MRGARTAGSVAGCCVRVRVRAALGWGAAAAAAVGRGAGPSGTVAMGGAVSGQRISSQL